jgi:hypothetical protein
MAPSRALDIGGSAGPGAEAAEGDDFDSSGIDQIEAARVVEQVRCGGVQGEG